MPRGRPQPTLSSDDKLAVILCLMQGKSIADTASETGATQDAVKELKENMGVRDVELSVDRRTALDHILEKLLLLGFDTIYRHTEYSQSKDWFERQKAGDIALFHKTLADQLFRLLEAYQQSGTSEENPATGTDVPGVH